MTDIAFCAFYNVGFCKNKDSCLNEHARDDCADKKCKKLFAQIGIEKCARMELHVNLI